MDLLKAAEKINKTLYESIKNKDSMVTVLDKLSEIKCHGVVFPRIMLVEIISNYTDKIESNKEPDMQSSFDNAERKWSDILN